ncbi:FAR1-related sequence 5-like protein [Tanacetum coccineum]
MEFIHEHQDPDMGESSIVRDHDMRESSMVRDHDMVESSMVRDDNVENQIVVLPEDLQQPGTINKNIVDISFYVDDSHEFQPTPNGTPYWVPDVPEDEKPKEGLLFDSYNDAYETYLVYSQKARFNIRKGGFKRKNGQKTHAYFQCNRAGKPRRSKEVNTLNEVDGDDGENSASKKRKRHSKSQAINCPAKLCLKKINCTESYEVLGFVENHNHPLMNLNNMDLSRARRQLHFDDYIFIHRASMSNLGPTRAHRLKAALVGGYDKVRGTSTDYCNFKRCVNSFIGDRDAQMLVDKMCKRKLHVPEFCFEYYTLPSKELVRLFWADETMKCNYVAFGDVVSFDATFHTNKYGYKFVPFTGIDHNQRCVTFGAALLSDETTESFSWMLEAFLKTHKKQPPFAVTDQDGALRKAVVKMFPDSHHRLCMWHITEKLPGKVLGDLAADTNFRKDFHKLVWNVYIGPDVFEQRWNDMISRYNLHDNKWLSDMYAIRERWVPGFFKDVPMCGLMKTTSRSESSNAFFQIYSHEGNTLVQFMLCFESAMEKQRYTQRVLDNASNGSTPTILTELLFEKHACDVYTPSIFREVQYEIHKSLYSCTQIRYDSEGSIETCIIQQMYKRSNPVIRATVVLNKKAGSFTCSCGHYNRHGFLCRHVFCVFRIYGIHKIPDVYLNRRWTKNVLPAHLLDKRHRYSPCIEETDTLASQVHQTIEECIGLFRNDTDKLSELLSTVQDLKKKLENEMQTPHVEPNKDVLYSDLLDVTVPDKVVIKTPKSIFRSKGTRRIKSAVEKGKAKTIARTNRKVPFKRRTCSACGGKGHNKATCEGCSACGEPGHHKGICKKFPNQDKGGWSGKKVVVDAEDEGDTDDQFDDEALGATEDEVGEDDEVDEEYESDEE